MFRLFSVTYLAVIHNLIWRLFTRVFIYKTVKLPEQPQQEKWEIKAKKS